MREMFAQAFSIIFARGFIRLAQVISFLLLSRSLSPAEFGIFGIITTAIPMASILGSLGLRQSFAYFIGRSDLSVGAAVKMLSIVCPPLSIAAGVIVWFLYGRSLQEVSNYPSTLILGMICLGVLGSMFVMLVQGIFLGRGEVKFFSLTEAMPRVILAIFSIILVLSGKVTILNSLWIFIFSFVVTSPVSYYLAVRRVIGFVTRFRLLPRMIGYGFAFAINMFMVTLNFRLGMFVLEHMSGAAAAGQYFAAARINEIFLEAATAFGLVLFSRSVRSEKKSDLLSQNARIACWTFWAFLIGGIVATTFAPFLLNVLAGEQYKEAAGFLQIMLLGLGPAAFAKIIYPTIAGNGEPYFGTVAIGFGLVVNGCLSLILIGYVGSVGVVISLVLSQYFILVGYVVICRQKFDIPIRDLLIPRSTDVRAVALVIGRTLGVVADR